MAALTDILRRFRLHGVPGAPAAAAVPAKGRDAAAEAELAVVFAVLEATQVEARRLHEAAVRDAGGRVAASAEEARLLVAEAASGAAVARADAAARIHAEASAERLALLDAARAEAARIGRVSAERIPPLVDDVVRRVLAIAGPVGRPDGVVGPPGGGEA